VLAADPAVEAGREALDQWGWRSYPWYDEAADAARPIDVSEPWYMKLNFWEGWTWPEWSWPWGFPNFSSSLFEWIAWGGLALLLAVLIYLIVRAYRMREQGRGGRKARKSADDTAEDRRRVEALPAGGPRWPADLLAETARLYQEANYRQAIVYLFSHQLVELDKHHLIRLNKGKTNRQYVRELGRRLPLRAVVENTMVAFEDVFFGNYAIDRARFESCWQRMNDFDRLIAGASS